MIDAKTALKRDYLTLLPHGMAAFSDLANI
jgi:hypothetical protein